MSSHRGRNRPQANGGPHGVERSYASQLKEHEPTFHTYEHLQGLPRGDAALTMLRKVASMVKPVMRKRGWNVQVLAEFLPAEANLLGLNINRGYKICIRLRYHNNPDLFLPIEQVIDTMLHELSHNVWGEHDANFHRLWDELRDELETLIRKGYTGEGFLSEGKRLGGGRLPPPHEMRRLAHASAIKRQSQNKLSKGSGQRLGGTPLHLQGGDIRNVIADQVTRRNTINKGCGSGRRDAVQLSDQPGQNTFKTKAEEDDANNRAIAQALYDLMEQEEERKLNGTFSAAPTNGGLAWDPQEGLYDPSKERLPEMPGSNYPQQVSEDDQMKWAMQESMRSNTSSPAALNAFGQPVSNGDAQDTPRVPEESKPSPVSAAATTNRTFSGSPISPLNTPSDDRSSSIRLRPSNASSSNNSAPARTRHIKNESTDAPLIDLSEPFNPTPTPSDQWTCEICTCINPLQYLQCDACGTERPQPIGIGNTGTRPRPKPRFDITPVAAQNDSLGWVCRCGAFMEHRWWTCSACGKMKESS